MRQEFTDRQKAQIYVRDRAICAFSGKSLWIAGYGLSPTYDIDWVDHIKPASRGGGNDVENGVCASYFFNSKKSSNSRDNQYLFFAGRPTEHFYYFHEVVPSAIASHLRRFSKAETSDWFFNRAVFRFMLGLAWVRSKNQGVERVRDDRYYAKSAIKALGQWRRLIEKQGSFSERGLLNDELSDDQVLLLQIQEADTDADVLEHMRNCIRIYSQSCDAMNELCKAESLLEMNELNCRVGDNPYIARRVRDVISANCLALERA